ncbi:MAG: hypothetical protein LBI57_04830 [Helicobacteraceae bacterium]|jgi:hypothetical protein|nr:hypothetical protein [Helicobacteraceae bacterium]
MRLILKVMACVGIVAQILSAGDALVESESLEGYTKYAIFSFYGKSASSGATTQAAPSAAEESDASATNAGSEEQAIQTDDSETLPVTEEIAETDAEEEVVNAEPQTEDVEAAQTGNDTQSDNAARTSPPQTQETRQSPLYYDDNECDDCSRCYCK